MECLRHYMRAHDITQQALAKSLGVGQSSVSQWLSGEKVPTLENFFSLARITGLSLDQLAADFRNGTSESSQRIPDVTIRKPRAIRVRETTNRRNYGN